MSLPVPPARSSDQFARGPLIPPAASVSDLAAVAASQPDLSIPPNEPVRVQTNGVAQTNNVPPTPAPASAPATPDSILDLLVTAGKLTPDQVNQIAVEAISSGATHEEILAEKAWVSEEELTKAKATLANIPYISIMETGVSPEALSMLPEGVAKQYGMLPFAVDKTSRTLSVAMKNPLDVLAIDFAEQKSGYTLQVYFAAPSDLDRIIGERYSQSLSNEVTAALEETSQVREDQDRRQNFVPLSGETIRQAPITKIVETILSFAVKARASDVHIESQEEHTRVRYRIDGILNEKLILPSSVHDAVVSRIKILSGLKIDEKRLPQDGRFDFQDQDQAVDLRVSTLPTIHGEKVVMRLLKKDMSAPSLQELGLSGLALRAVQDAIKVPHGIVLITGPTGSGKTTTLYSILHTINSPRVNIMTLEDPVEYEIPGVNQVQVNAQAGLTFASGLRSFLRQDPNVIMVGEIRDSETAELAIQASLTGHLVFSTLHTSSAAGALPRLLDMGAEPFLLSSSMTLTMAQRVARRINPDYVEEYTPEPAVLKDIQDVLGDRFTAWCKQKNLTPDQIKLRRPKAERPSTEPEYKGRIAIFEVMRITEEIGKLILERRPAVELERVAVKDGMVLMKQDGYLKALEGITTIEEILRVAEI